MEFFKIRRDIPFMRHALAFNLISALTFVLAVVFLAWKGLNFSIEFTGGTVMEVHYGQAPDINKIRDNMTKLGFPVRLSKQQLLPQSPQVFPIPGKHLQIS